MLMLALARAENMVAATPLRLAIWCPTAASTQQSEICSTLEMRPARIASPNLHSVAGGRGFAWRCLPVLGLWDRVRVRVQRCLRGLPGLARKCGQVQGFSIEGKKV